MTKPKQEIPMTCMQKTSKTLMRDVKQDVHK